MVPRHNGASARPWRIGDWCRSILVFVLIAGGVTAQGNVVVEVRISILSPKVQELTTSNIRSLRSV
jgi:hypothetical protein